MEDQKTWTILDVLQWGTDYLKRHEVPEPRLSMEWMLSKALQSKRLQLYLQFDRPMGAAELAQVKASMLQRVQRVPLQYILGEWDFYGLPMGVGPGVFIPRPETELLVESVLKSQRKNGISVATNGLDLGTGSGCIAIALLTNLAESRCIAIDLSDQALQQARLNAQRHGVSERIDFRQGNWFAPLAMAEARQFDWIVSNPPYVAAQQWDTLPEEVRRYEPREALWGGTDGLEPYQNLVCGAERFLKSGGILALEIAQDQCDAVRATLSTCAGMRFEQIVQDHNGRDRIVLASHL